MQHIRIDQYVKFFSHCSCWKWFTKNEENIKRNTHFVYTICHMMFTTKEQWAKPKSSEKYICFCVNFKLDEKVFLIWNSNVFFLFTTCLLYNTMNERMNDKCEQMWLRPPFPPPHTHTQSFSRSARLSNSIV